MNASLSSDPSAACPRIAGLWARVPPAWESANYTERACSVPACNNFPSTLATCCGREEIALDYFNTTIGPYVSCNLDSSDDKAYQNYQQCLLSNFVTPFKCNDNDGLANSDVCQGGTAAPPQDPGPGEQICVTQATPNATRTMISCCSNAAANGTGLIPFDNGCSIACSSESTDGEFTDGEFSKCLSDAFDPQIGIVCSKQDDSKASNKNGDTSSAHQGPLPSLGILGIGLLALLAIT